MTEEDQKKIEKLEDTAAQYLIHGWVNAACQKMIQVDAIRDKYRALAA